MATDLARAISRALINVSNQRIPTRSWTPLLEQTLHRLVCRDSLNPTLVARVIDPFLLNHHSLALGFFNWAAQQPGFTHNAATYQSVIKSICNSRQYGSVDKLLKQVRAQKLVLDPSVYRSAIASLVAGKKAHLAFSVFVDVSHLISDIGSDICNSLLAGLSADGNLKCAKVVFDKMIQRGVRMNTLGFGVFLWRFCRKNDLLMTLGLLDTVRKIDFVAVNGSIIAVLVAHGLCLEARSKDAASALDELRERECKPDFMAYRIVSETFRVMGNVVDSEIVLKKKRKLGVAPRANDYREFIFQLISERLIYEAKELSQVIIDGNFPIEDDVLNALIGTISAIDLHKAISFLEFMVGKERLPTLHTLINLCTNLNKHGKCDELEEVFHLLSAKDYFKDLESYNVIISFLCKAGKVKEAYSVLQEMKKKGFAPGVSAYNSLLEACCRGDMVQPAKRLWDEMFANGCCGNTKTYNILIWKFLEIGQVEDANRLFGHMKGKGVPPDAVTYISLLEGLCESKNLELALQVFNESVEQDIMLANTILSTFIHCLCKEGFLLPASRLLCNGRCGLEFLESHLTFLRHLAQMGEVSLANEHMKWVADKSQALLHAIHNEVAALPLSSLELDKTRKLSPKLQRDC